MTCDCCKQPIDFGQQYSLTEHGRLHAACLRGVAPPGRHVQGEGRRSDFFDPIYVWRNEEAPWRQP